MEGDITDNYNLGEQLCQGWFAKVIDARTKDSDEPRAIKVMEVANADTAVRKAWLAQEIEITRRVQHKNIVKLYEIVRNDKFYYFVYEKVKSDLWDFLRKLRGDSLWVAQWHAAYLVCKHMPPPILPVPSHPHTDVRRHGRHPVPAQARHRAPRHQA